MRTIEEKHGPSDDGERPEPTTEVHKSSDDGPGKRNRAWYASPVVIIIAIIAGIAWGIPILQGYHFGCNVLAGDIYRESRLGIEMCRGISHSEVKEREEHAQHEQEVKAKAESEAKQQEEQTHRQTQEAEETKRNEQRPGHEAAAAKLSAEAGSLRRKQRHEEASVKADEAEAEHLEGEASSVEGAEHYEEASKIRERANASREHADSHRQSEDTYRSEAEGKEQEAKHEQEQE